MDKADSQPDKRLTCALLGDCPYPKPIPDTSIETQWVTALAHSIILYPNLGCPAIIEPGQDLTVYLLLNEELVQNFYLSQKNKEGVCLFRNRLNLQLRYVPWNQMPHAKKCAAIQHASPLMDANPNAYQHIKTTEPIRINPSKTLEFFAENQKIVGRVPAILTTHYTKRGFCHWIRMTWIKPNFSKGLYNLMWFSIKPDAILDPLFEPQDELMHLGLQTYQFGHDYGFRIHNDSNNGLQIDDQRPIQSYHPIYVTDKAYLNIGHLTDIHLSSRQHAMKLSPAQTIPGASEQESPMISSLLHNTYDSVKDLLDQMGSRPETDCLVLTGDFVDYAYNLDIMHTQQKIKTPIPLWEKLQLYEQWKNNQLHKTHTLGIDQVSLYSLLLYFYDRYEKPILIVGGNHDGYCYPYGISPRINSLISPDYPDEKHTAWLEDKKANASIPLDHNLTFFEAMLLFGQGSRDVILARNFNPEFQLLLWHLFNPLNDWKIIYKNQCFIGIGWGEKESIPLNPGDAIEAFAFKGGALPRPSEALSSWHWHFLNELPDTQYKILLMHAPVLSFDPIIPLNQTINEPQTVSVSPYNQGSFKSYRQQFFKEILGKRKITHILSGHSHRSALYCCEKIKEEKGELLYHPRAFNLEQVYNPKEKIGIRTRLIVSGSAGPLSVTNHDNQLAGLGISRPTGTCIQFSDSEDSIQPLYARCNTAKPRLAALLDYYDIEMTEKGFILPGIGRFPESNEYSFHCDHSIPQPIPLFSAAKLHYYHQKQWKSFDLKLKFMTGQSRSTYHIKLDMGLLHIALNKSIKPSEIVLTLLFNQKLSTHEIYQSYNLQTPWQFPIEFFILDSQPNLKLYYFRRPKHLKEKPDFNFYQQLYTGLGDFPA